MLTLKQIKIVKRNAIAYKMLLFILSFWITCDPRATELSEEDLNAKHTHLMTIQYLPQDAMISILSSVDYPTLRVGHQVCKTWHALLADKIPIKQRYTLKLIQQFSKGFKTFEEIFLTPLTELPFRKIALDDIIEELREELGGNEEQSYQALLDTKLMQSCPSMGIRISVNNNQFTTKKEIIFPYIPPNLLDQVLKEPANLEIKIGIQRIEKDIIQFFGLKNLSVDHLSKVTELNLSGLKLRSMPRQIKRLSELYRLGLFNNQLSSIPAEITKELPNCTINI